MPANTPPPNTPKDAPDKPLTARQRRFVDLLAVEDNAADAARRAGYRPVAAKQTASKLMKRPQVQAALAEARDGKAAPLTREAVLEELRAVAFANMMDYVSIRASDGRMTLNTARLTRDQAAGFRELVIDETTNGRTGIHKRHIRVRMGAKVFALSRLLAALPEAGEAPRRGGSPKAVSKVTKVSRPGDRRVTRVSPEGDRGSKPTR